MVFEGPVHGSHLFPNGVRQLLAPDAMEDHHAAEAFVGTGCGLRESQHGGPLSFGPLALKDRDERWRRRLAFKERVALVEHDALLPTPAARAIVGPPRDLAAPPRPD